MNASLGLTRWTMGMGGGVGTGRVRLVCERQIRDHGSQRADGSGHRTAGGGGMMIGGGVSVGGLFGGPTFWAHK